jgi:ATP-binding cassette subfamily B protein
LSGAERLREYNMKAKLAIILQAMGRSRWLYVGAVASVALAAVFTYAGPLVLRATIDSVIGDEPLAVQGWLESLLHWLGGIDHLADNLYLCGLLVIGLTIVAGLFSFVTGRWSAMTAETAARNLRERLYDHIQHLPYDNHVKMETGDTIQRCTSDLETLRRFLAMQFVQIGRAISMVAVALPVLFRLHVPLALVSVPVIPIIFLFSYLFFLRIQKAFRMSDEAEGRLSTVLQENLTGVRVVRAFARERYEMDKFDARNTEYRDLTYKLIRLLAKYWSISDFMSMFQIGAVLIVGTVWALSGAISIGTLVVFVSYEGMLLWPIRQMGRILADMGKADVALTRIAEVLAKPREANTKGNETPEIRGAVSFKNVSFSYGDGRQILKNLSFSIEPGTTVGILGPTGSGKSTLVHLLPRLYDYEHGSITLDGVELATIDRKWVRRHIGFVLQEPFLYAKSIRENIGIAQHHLEDEEVFEAARVASVHDVILAFDQGYGTLVGERGVTLSGGQKQRVAIARALVHASPILVFDDSLSAVDTETDAAIREGLLRRSERATTFIISHRLTTLSQADLILVIEDGKIVEQGSHEQLLAHEGLYRRLWQVQGALETEMESEFATDSRAPGGSRVS